MKGKNYNTKNKSIGKNTCEYIILHHTGTREGTATGIINAFTGQRAVSAHALIDEKGNLYTFGDYTDILWHAGQSNWGERVDLNRYSIGIELI